MAEENHQIVTGGKRANLPRNNITVGNIHMLSKIILSSMSMKFGVTCLQNKILHFTKLRIYK